MHLRLRRVLVLLSIICLPVFEQAATQYPLTVVDGTGHSLTFTGPPERISSLTLFTDEVLLELIDPDRISSMTFLADNPVYSSISGRIPAHVQLIDMNVEAILSIYPDIVFAANWSDSAKVRQLRDAGVQVYLIETPLTLVDIQAQIMTLADLLDAAEAGKALVAEMNEKLEQLTPQINAIKKRQIKVLDYNTWGAASGAGTTWHEVVTKAGLINGVASIAGDKFGQVALSKEMVVSVNPNILFLPGWVYGDPEGSDRFKKQVLADPALAGVKAIREEQLYLIPERLRGTFSHHIVETIEFVVNAVSVK